jgi:TolB protein
VDLAGGVPDTFTGARAISVNLPGSCWVAGRIVYSTDEFDDRDEIYLVDAAGGTPQRVTDRPGFAAFEPSLSPDGAWVVFESHVLDVEGDGALFKVRSDGSELTMLTDGSTDDRQPNWSPAGDRILFQSHLRVPGNIDIYTMDVDGGGVQRVTDSSAEDTDASFSPDGTRIVYSSNEGDLPNANLFVISTAGGAPVRASISEGYDGAPSWSPDGRWLAFESSAGDPDGSAGTELWIVPAPI